MNVFNQLNCYSINLIHLSQVKSIYCTDKSTCWIHLWSGYIGWFFREE